MRWVWREGATEAVIEFLEGTPVGSRSSGMARAKLDDRGGVGQVSEGEEGGPGPPQSVFFLCFFPLSMLPSFFCPADDGEEVELPQYDP